MTGIQVLDELIKAKKEMATKRQIAYVYRTTLEKKLDKKEQTIRAAFQAQEAHLQGQLTLLEKQCYELYSMVLPDLKCRKAQIYQSWTWHGRVKVLEVDARLGEYRVERDKVRLYSDYCED